MKYAAKVDSNQKEIITIFKSYGITVQDLSAVGKKGVPDLIVSRSGYTFPVEVIGPEKLKRFPPDGRTEGQVEWHEAWGGYVYTVKDIDEATQLAKWMRGLPTFAPCIFAEGPKP